MINISDLLRALGGAGVDFILVGGVAAAAHGSACRYRLSTRPDNLARIVAALKPAKPYLRGPARVAVSIRHQNFGGRFEDLVDRSISAKAFGVRCRVLSLNTLIATKRAAGRPKDFAELEILRERTRAKD